MQKPSSVNDRCIKLEPKNITVAPDDAKKLYVFTSGGKSYTILKSQLPQILCNQMNERNVTLVAKPLKADLQNNKDTTVKVTAPSIEEPDTVDRVIKRIIQ